MTTHNAKVPKLVVITIFILFLDRATAILPTTTETIATKTTGHIETSTSNESKTNHDSEVALDVEPGVLDAAQLKRVKRQVPSLKDLEDSFGGHIVRPGSSIEESSIQSTTKGSKELPRPPNRRIGFYYLLDWNSFLEVDNQQGTRVNLRIQPKFGNPSRFIPVAVP